MIYLSLGELGHNSNQNFYKKNEAQRLPTKKEVADQNYTSYVGKVLRMTPEGKIPADNPILNGVQSHVYTLGHRNPQGLVFAGNNLYSSEHGPSSDDELNLLVAGGNYGWPHVAGYIDNQAYQYINWSHVSDPSKVNYDPNIPVPGIPVARETDWKKPANYQNPVKTFYTVKEGYNFHDSAAEDGDHYYLKWPTVAPAGLAYYPKDGVIPGWGNSILMATMKVGTVFRIPLHSSQNDVQGEVETLFESSNRYRDIAVSPDGKSLYLITDSAGLLIRDREKKPTVTPEYPGAVIVITYSPK